GVTVPPSGVSPPVQPSRGDAMRARGGFFRWSPLRWIVMGACAWALGAGLVPAAPAGPTGASNVPPGPAGYRLLGADGGVFNFSSPFEGSAASDPARCPANPPGRSMPFGSCSSIAPTPSGAGYYILNAFD